MPPVASVSAPSPVGAPAPSGPLSASDATAAQAPALALTAPQRRLALTAVLLAVALTGVDTAIANTALPTIAKALGIGAAESVWIVNAYQLAIVATLLPFAALSDRLGPRRLCLGGLVGFLVCSAAAALSQQLWHLVLARMLQGLSVSAMMSVNVALIRLIFPPSQLGRGMGLNALVVGVGVTLGPTITSAVLAVASWPWLFAITVPLALTALLCGRAGLPRTPPGRGVDGLTAALTAITFAAFIGALGSFAQRAPAARVLALAAVALVAGALLLRRQAGHPAPMLPVDLLKRPLFALSVATSVASFTSQGLAFVGLPFYFQTVLHHDAITTGLLMTPWAILVAVAAPIAGPLSDRYPAGLLGGIGLALLASGLVALAVLPPQAPLSAIVLRMALCGLGFGLFQAPNLKAIMSSAPPSRASGASGMVAMARITGQTTGAAAVALCFGLAGERGPVWALWLGAAAAAAAAAASAARLLTAERH